MNYLNKTKYPKYNIYLLNKKKEEIHKFYVDLGHLSFLGQELRNVYIYVYPIIILEFMTGYFTTEELYKKNKELSFAYNNDFEIMEKPASSIKHSMIVTTKSGINDIKETKENIKENQTETQKELKINKNVSSNNEINIQRTEKEIISKSINKKSYSQPIKKKGQENSGKQIQCTDYFLYISTFQMLKFYIDPQGNTEKKNQNFKAELGIFNENLEKVTNQLKPNKVNYDNKLNQLKANLNGRGQYQLIYDSFVYQKMAEICFVFFNNKIPSLYSIPPFYNEPINY